MITTKDISRSLVSVSEKENNLFNYSYIFLLIGLWGAWAVLSIGVMSSFDNKAIGALVGISLLFSGLASIAFGLYKVGKYLDRHAQAERKVLVESLHVFAENTYGVRIPSEKNESLLHDIKTPFLTRTATGEVAEAKFALFENEWVLLINGKEAPRVGPTSNGQEFWTEENKAKYSR